MLPCRAVASPHWVCIYAAFDPTLGSCCSYYLGADPVVLTADPDMLQQCLIKQFYRFSTRKVRRASRGADVNSNVVTLASRVDAVASF